MNFASQFKYFLSDATNSVQKNSEIWSIPLPTTRKQPQRVTGSSVTYGDYFSAVHSFLEQNRFEILISAFSKSINQHIALEEIEEIRVCLVKHGELYHPARVETSLRGLNLKFVLNVAISDSGKGYINKEYNALKRLNSDFAFSFVPHVYGIGKACAKGREHEIIMFLGEWFDGYNEFHISYDNAEKQNKIEVWDPDQGHYFLSSDNTMELYRQAAMILTCYYNIETFEQIFPWHHAAGDFVIRLQNNQAEPQKLAYSPQLAAGLASESENSKLPYGRCEELQLKLITVRQYAPMFAKKEGDKDTGRDVEMILEALLVFLLNLSIRMRLDRLNGVGDIVWSDDIAVQGTLKGFFQGLQRKDSTGLFSDSFGAYFHDYLLSSCTEKDFYDLSLGIVDSYNPLAPEIPVIRQNIKKHAEVFFNAITEQL